MVQPWRGDEYERTRLLLLGESAYSWVEDGETVHPSPRHSQQLVEWIVSDFEGCLDTLPFMVKLSRALANEESPTTDRLRAVWARVAFTNYVTTSVGTGPRVRPTEEMWAQGEDQFRPLLDALKPARVVVLGKTLWRHMPATQVGITDDVQQYVLADGRRCTCWAVNHPSRGLSWRDLAAIVQFAVGPELSAP